MATKKISELSAITTPTSAALFPIVQSSTTVSVTLANIAANMPDLSATTLTTGTLTTTGNATIGGDLTISGDDLTMGTNTSGAALIADGTNFNPVVISGDISIGTSGTAAIGSGVIVNADVNSSAAIAFSKMADLTASRALVSDGSGDVSVSAVTSTEVGYLDGVSSAIQTQLDGKASSTYVPTTITVADESTDTTCFPLFVTAATGDLPPKSGSNLAFNSNTGALTATSFVGNLTGNVTGNTSGTSGSTTGNAATATVLETARNIGGVSFNGSASIDLPGVNSSGNQNTSGTAAIATAVTVADESSDTTCNVLFTTAATGDLPPKSGTNLTFNSSSGVLTATGFAGNLTGNVTGNTSGSSGSTTGNAATATILATARDIGGVSFNGSASIDLPGVNTSGSQNTSGTAAGLSATLAVGSGGTGATSLTANGALIGNGTGAVTAVDMSTKGHLLAGDGSGNPSALAVGTNTHVLTADSSEATGLKWAAATGGTPTDITVADESSDTTCFPLFVTAATGDLGPKTGSNLAFNSSSGLLTATSFEGALDLNGAELVLDADADTSIHANTDDQIDIKVGNTDVAHIVNTGVSQGALLNRNPTPIVINGDMKIAQRGDMTGITSGQYITTDRFFINMINLGTWSFAKSTDAPTGLGFASSLKIDCTTADASPAAGDNFYLSMQSEGQNLQIMEKGTSSARTSTIAYWIKSNKTGNYVVELWDRTNDRHVGKVVTISSANTWEKHVCNFPADTSGALANTNARSIMLSWAFDSGSNFTSGTLPTSWQARVDANRFVGTNLGLGDNTANEVLITGVQWEMGTFTSSTMPPFQHEDAGTSLARCQRYYFKQGDEGGYAALGSGVCESTSSAYIMINLPSTMRSSPSVSFTGNITLFDGDTFNTSSSIGSTQKGTNCLRLSVTANSSVANGHGATLHVENSSSFVEFASEL